MSGNPPDKPGYRLLPLTGGTASDEQAINALTDQGYRVEFATQTYLLFANYDKKES